MLRVCRYEPVRYNGAMRNSGWYIPYWRKPKQKGKADKGPDPRDHEKIGTKLVETLGHFGVEAKLVGIVSGPHVSRYELRLAPGTKVKKVTELARAMVFSLWVVCVK